MSGDFDDVRIVDASDEAQVGAAQRADLTDASHDRALLREQLSTAPGREFVWRQLSRAGIYEDCPVTDAAVMAAFLGRRRIGLELLGEIVLVAEREFLTMQREAMVRDKRRRAENVAARTTAAAQADTSAE